jgi:hypothetical protein
MISNHLTSLSLRKLEPQETKDISIQSCPRQSSSIPPKEKKKDLGVGVEFKQETECKKIVDKKDQSIQFSPSKSNCTNQPPISSEESLFEDSIESTESFRNNESGVHINNYYNIVNNYLCRKSIQKNHGLRRKKIRK